MSPPRPCRVPLSVVLLLLLPLLPCALALNTSSTCPPVRRCLHALSHNNPCPVLPLPPPAVYPPIDPQGFNLTALRPGVFSYADGLYQTLLVYRAGRLVIVDFPTSPFSTAPDGRYLLIDAIRQVIRQAPLQTLDMVYSHRHADHIGNAALVRDFVRRAHPRARIRVWGTPETRDTIRARRLSGAPVPTVLVPRAGRTLSLFDDLSVRLVVVGGHTGSDIASWVPPSGGQVGVVHFVDVMTPRAAPFLRVAATEDLREYLQAHDRLLALDWEVLSAGHGVLGTRRDVRVNREYVESVVAAAGAAMKEVGEAEVGGLFARWGEVGDVVYRNTQWVFGELYERWGGICRREVIRKWGCVLGGVDIFAASHCESALLYLSIDV